MTFQLAIGSVDQAQELYLSWYRPSMISSAEPDGCLEVVVGVGTGEEAEVSCPGLDSGRWRLGRASQHRENPPNMSDNERFQLPDQLAALDDQGRDDLYADISALNGDQLDDLLEHSIAVFRDLSPAQTVTDGDLAEMRTLAAVAEHIRGEQRARVKTRPDYCIIAGALTRAVAKTHHKPNTNAVDIAGVLLHDPRVADTNCAKPKETDNVEPSERWRRTAATMAYVDVTYSRLPRPGKAALWSLVAVLWLLVMYLAHLLGVLDETVSLLDDVPLLSIRQT